VTAAAGGRVSLVGAGPGDPGLLTVRGRRCLEGADVVIYDNLSNPALLVHARPDAEIVFTGKHGEGRRLTQDEISALIVEHARTGRWVVRLKGGDPFIFGRGGEEAVACVGAGIPFEIVPGVTAAIAVPAYAGIPLTHRDHASTVTFVTGHERAKTDPDPSVPWERLAQERGTLVLFMSVLQLEANLQRLIEGGIDPATPAAAIRWGTTARQEVLTGTVATLPQLAAARRLRPPAIVVIGEVAGLAAELDWVTRRSLFGRRIVVTRPAHQVQDFATLLEERGAEVVAMPTIATVPPASWAPVDAAFARLGGYAWLVLTSQNGVEAFFTRLRTTGHDVRALHGVSIAAIGPQTRAAVEARGLQVALTPAVYRAEAVADALLASGIAGRRVLLARAGGARTVLPEQLVAAGAVVDDVALYRTVLPAVPAGLRALFAGEAKPDMVTFTSSSTVTNFARLFDGQELRDVLRGVAVGCIGPITAATARTHGLAIAVEPPEFTIPALTTAIETYFTSK
jgi:uroporphyrinogen III methyltransferase/synthase